MIKWKIECRRNPKGGEWEYHENRWRIQGKAMFFINSSCHCYSATAATLHWTPKTPHPKPPSPTIFVIFWTKSKNLSLRGAAICCQHVHGVLHGTVSLTRWIRQVGSEDGVISNGRPWWRVREKARLEVRERQWESSLSIGNMTAHAVASETRDWGDSMHPVQITIPSRVKFVCFIFFTQKFFSFPKTRRSCMNPNIFLLKNKQILEWDYYIEHYRVRLLFSKTH